MNLGLVREIVRGRDVVTEVDKEGGKNPPDKVRDNDLGAVKGVSPEELPIGLAKLTGQT